MSPIRQRFEATQISLIVMRESLFNKRKEWKLASEDDLGN